MTTDLIPAIAALLVAVLCAYVTLHERAVSAAEPHTSDATQWDHEAGATEPSPAESSAIKPGPRDRCQCGHTYDWHHSCPRDICGCREFSYLREPREQRHEAA